MKIRNTLTILLTMLWLTANAQDNINMKFGKPTKEELQMTVYEADPDADAVVLCRLTSVEYTVQMKGYLVDYHEKFRIKILKPQGARCAKVTIPYHIIPQEKSGIHATKFSLRAGNIQIGTVANDFYEEATGSFTEDAMGVYTNESVEDLKATAFNLVNGKTVKSHFRGTVTKEQTADDTWQATFTIPDVREGTVIEYEYCLHSQLFYQLHDWYAQCDIPVAYARLDMDIPVYLMFNIEEHGIQRLQCSCVTGSMRYKLESDPLAAPVQVNTNHYTCIGRQLKAMPKDPYVWNVNDYCAGITAELKSYSLRGTLAMEYAQTWEQIDQMLLDDDDLGRQLNNHSPLRDELQAARLTDITNERERVAAVCQLVMNRVTWDGTYRLWPDASSAILKRGTGSNADINLLLIQTLRDAGYDASPVVLRTRDQGKMPYHFPSIWKLNTYVVAIPLSGGTQCYVDGSSSTGYLNVLPPVLQVERARLVAKGKKSQWVNLQKVTPAKQTTVIDATLTPDGQLTGTQTTLLTGNLATPHSSSFTPEAKTVTPVSLQGQVTDSSLRINLLPLLPLQDNPFTSPQRLMPVEYPYTQTRQVIINITLPQGYTLPTLPEPLAATTPDKGITGRQAVYLRDGKVEVHYQFNVNKVVHDSKNYAAIRDMYTLFTDKARHELLIEKK